jgi:hypothetical protein
MQYLQKYFCNPQIRDRAAMNTSPAPDKAVGLSPAASGKHAVIWYIRGPRSRVILRKIRWTPDPRGMAGSHAKEKSARIA